VVTEKESVDQFHLFSFLPRELRRKIWKFALPEPRILELVEFRHSLQPNGRDFAVVPLCFECGPRENFKSDMETLQRVFREAQVVVSENYGKIKAREAPIASMWDENADLELSEIGYTTRVNFFTEYFDFKRDLLLLDIQNIQQLSWENVWLDLSKVENIALNCNPVSTTLRSIAEFVDEWPHLGSLQIMLGNRHPYSYHDSLTEVARLIDVRDLMDLD